MIIGSTNPVHTSPAQTAPRTRKASRKAPHGVTLKQALIAGGAMALVAAPQVCAAPTGTAVARATTPAPSSIVIPEIKVTLPNEPKVVDHSVVSSIIAYIESIIAALTGHKSGGGGGGGGGNGGIG